MERDDLIVLLKDSISEIANEDELKAALSDFSIESCEEDEILKVVTIYSKIDCRLYEITYPKYDATKVLHDPVHQANIQRSLIKLTSDECKDFIKLPLYVLGHGVAVWQSEVKCSFWDFLLKEENEEIIKNCAITLCNNVSNCHNLTAQNEMISSVQIHSYLDKIIFIDPYLADNEYLPENIKEAIGWIKKDDVLKSKLECMHSLFREENDCLIMNLFISNSLAVYENGTGKINPVVKRTHWCCLGPKYMDVASLICHCIIMYYHFMLDEVNNDYTRQKSYKYLTIIDTILSSYIERNVNALDKEKFLAEVASWCGILIIARVIRCFKTPFKSPKKEIFQYNPSSAVQYEVLHTAHRLITSSSNIKSIGSFNFITFALC